MDTNMFLVRSSRNWITIYVSHLRALAKQWIFSLWNTKLHELQPARSKYKTMGYWWEISFCLGNVNDNHRLTARPLGALGSIASCFAEGSSTGKKLTDLFLLFSFRPLQPESAQSDHKSASAGVLLDMWSWVQQHRAGRFGWGGFHCAVRIQHPRR